MADIVQIQRAKKLAERLQAVAEMVDPDNSNICEGSPTFIADRLNTVSDLIQRLEMLINQWS